MATLRFIAFLLLACAIAVTLPFVPFVGRLLGSIACTPEESFEWKQTSAGSEVSFSWVCVDAQGRFNVSSSSVREGEVAAFGLSFAAGSAIAAIPFVVAWVRRRRRAGTDPPR